MKMLSATKPNSALTFYTREIPKCVLLQTVKTQIKCSIMLHFIRVYTVCKGKKRSSDIQIHIIFLIINYNGTPQGMKIGLSPSLLYQTRRKNPLVYKELNYHMTCYPVSQSPNYAFQ